MFQLDMKTVVMSYLITNMLCTGVALLLWLQYRRKFAGTGFWLAGFTAQTAALVLIGARGAVPAWLSIIVSNVLFIEVAILWYSGFQSFVSQPGRQTHNYTLLAVFLVMHTYFTYGQPNLAARIINVSLILLIIFAHGAWLLLRRVRVEMRPITLWPGVVFIGYVATSIGRLIANIGLTPGLDLFQDTALFDIWMVLLFQMLNIALTFSLFLMLSRRLLEETRAQQEALQQNAERYRKAQHIGKVGNWEYDLLTRKLWGSEEANRLYGFDPRREQITLEEVERCVPERQHVRQALADLIEGRRRHYRIEFDLIAKDTQQRRTVLLLAEVEQDAQGNPSKVTGVIQDITERKQEEAALAKEKRRLTDVIEGTNVGTWEWNVQTGETVFNERWAAMLGYTLDELAPTTIETWTKFTHPDDLEQAQELLARHFAGELDYYECEARMRHKDGRWVWVLDRGKVVTFTQDGKPLLMSGSHQDITTRKQAEKALRESEQRYRLLAENATDVIWTLNLEGRFMYVSPSVERLRGYTPEEVMQQPLEEALTPGSLPIALNGLRKVYTTKDYGPHNVTAYRSELEQPCKDGTTVWTEAITARMYNDAGEFVGILGVTRDITERRELEEQLRQAKATAEAANQAKSAFLAQMSHELRTPLNAVLGYTQVLQRDRTLTAKQAERIATIHRSGEHLLMLINEVLDLAKIESGKIELVTKEFHLPSALHTVVNLMRVRAQEKDLRIEYTADSDLPQRVMGDERRLRQVLLNLLGNAIKFTDLGSVTLRVTPLSFEETSEVKFHHSPSQWRQETSTLRFEVEDTGVGIPADKLQTIFEPFQQVGDACKQQQGTGLGLAISAQLVRLMGSDLLVESRPGEGSHFWFDLALPVLSPNQQKATSEQHVIGFVESPKTILVVDDQEDNRRLAAEMLAPLGFTVLEAEDGEQAVTVAQSPPDLILMDLKMPGMNGFEALRQIRALPQGNRIAMIACSASVFPEIQQRSREAGTDDFLAKPLQYEALLPAVQRHLGLTWQYAGPEPIASDEPQELRLPDAALLADLRDMLRIGDILGIRERLDELEREPALRPFVAALRPFEQAFDLNGLKAWLETHAPKLDCTVS